MAVYNILNYKNLIFFTPQQIDKDPNKGDIVSIDGVSYVVIDSGFPSSLNPMFIVWPVKLSFPFDFMENSKLFDWLKNHLKGLIIEVKNDKGRIIKGKVEYLYPDVTFKILPNYSSKEVSFNYYYINYHWWALKTH